MSFLGVVVGAFEDSAYDLVVGVGSAKPDGKVQDKLQHVGQALLEVAHNPARYTWTEGIRGEC